MWIRMMQRHLITFFNHHIHVYRGISVCWLRKKNKYNRHLSTKNLVPWHFYGYCCIIMCRYATLQYNNSLYISVKNLTFQIKDWCFSILFIFYPYFIFKTLLDYKRSSNLSALEPYRFYRSYNALLSVKDSLSS